MSASANSFSFLVKKAVRNSIDFFYCKSDGVQEGVEKLLNCWVYEIIAIVGLFAGFLGIGLGQEQAWDTAGYLWLGPLLFSFLLNIALILNYFGVVKRSTRDEQGLFFPEQISQLLKINMYIGFFLPFGIFAKGMLYKHFYKLYKDGKLPWVSPNDSRQEKKRKFKQARLAKKKALDESLRAKSSPKVAKKEPVTATKAKKAVEEKKEKPAEKKA